MPRFLTDNFVKFFARGSGKAALTLGFFGLVAKLTGLLRDRVLASQFGASSHLDVYFSAFIVPDLIFNLFILGAVSSALIPVFIEHYREDKERAWLLAQNVVNAGFLCVLAASAVIFIFAPQLAHLVAPGFSGYEYELLVKLLRLMLLSTLIFSVSTVVGSILQALERFLSYAIAPVLYNLGIIFGALYIAPFMALRGYNPVLGLGLGVVVGAFLHFLIQFPAVHRAGFRFGRTLSFSNPGLRKIFRLMLPRTIGIGGYSIELLAFNAFASLLGAGSVAVLNFANNLQFVPISIFGISVATAVFPRLSGDAAAGERAGFRNKLNAALAQTVLIVGTVAILMFVLRDFIVRTLFQTGAFGGADAHLTASVLGIFLLGVIAQSLIPILSRAFYAMQNTRTPVIISLSSIAFNLVLAAVFVFSFGWGIRGLAFSSVIAGNVNFVALYFAFRKKYR